MTYSEIGPLKRCTMKYTYYQERCALRRQEAEVL
jgi:hypothetical protein